MRILVTGGAGYVGSVVAQELADDGHQVVVFDNLYKGHRDAVPEAATFIQSDLLDEAAIRDALETHDIAAVVHMAADSLVGESIADPRKYYRNNLQAGLKLLDAMVDCEVRKLVLSSTVSVYGEPSEQPIRETSVTTPVNPYGDTKLALEHALRWYDDAYGLRFVSLRYFNAAGATARLGERHNPETHLIPLILQTALGQRAGITIFGDDYPTPDGTAIRDYIHVRDLARAHILALKTLDVDEARSQVYNLGCGGSGTSVKQAIDAARRVTRRKIPSQVGARRSGDPAVLIASSERIRAEIGWEPSVPNIEDIIASAWEWMLGRENT